MEAQHEKSIFSTSALFRNSPNSLINKILTRLLDKLLGLSRLDTLYRSLPEGLEADEFLSRALEVLEVGYDNDLNKLSSIPEHGPVIVVANHPFGGLDGMVLTLLLRKYRPDVKVMANHVLGSIPEISECFIKVDPFQSKAKRSENTRAIRDSIDWLKQGRLLLVFPAGEVSSFQVSTLKIMDKKWHNSIARLARMSGASVNPVYIHGRNSLLFNVSGFIHPILRTIRLPAEILGKRGYKINWMCGSNIPSTKLGKFKDSSELISYLRMKTYILADSILIQDDISASNNDGIATPESAISQALLKAEVENLPADQLLVKSNQFQVFHAQADQMPWMMQEIGRLREITFRTVGEGTGNAADIDLFDAYYDHIILWHVERQEIAGAYRLGKAATILEKFGKKGLYTFSLFHYKNRFVPRLGNAIELGRSFIRPEYQRDISPLNLLWKGIACYVLKDPDYPVLFGPVSLSCEYNPESRKLIIESLKNNAFSKEYARLIKPRNPYRDRVRYRWRSSDLKQIKNIEIVSDLVSQIEPDNKGIPVLFRQYLKLGGQFLGFNVDPVFSNVIDGLIVVDLRQTDLKILGRYMGREAAQDFLDYHRNLQPLSGTSRVSENTG